MRVLVTGVSGFSGSHIAREIARAGHEVVGIHRRDTAFLRTLDGISRLRFACMDVVDVAKLPESFDAVVHAAATSPATGVTAARIVSDNIPSMTALVAAAEQWGCRRFVFLSSLSLYGEVSGPVLDESSPMVNPDVYGATKYLGERMLAELSDRLPSLSLRLPGVLGPGAHRNWLANATKTLREGEPIRAFNLDGPYNNAVHVADLAALILRAIENPASGADALVLGARGTLLFGEVIERLARGLGVLPRIEPIPAPKPPFILSSERAITRWGYAPMDIGSMIDRYASEARLSA
jgi:UDP-glucose 4-epimerase